MMKLVSVAVVGFVVGVMGCQAQAAVPPQTPQGGGAMASPPPPNAGGPDPAAQHREAWEHHHDGVDERMAHCDCGGPHMPPRWHAGPGHTGPAGGHEIMGELGALGVHFYPPQLLLRRAQKIGLTPDQVTKIRQEMLGSQARSVDLRAKIEHAKVEATRLLAADKLDEHAVDAQIDEAAKAAAELHKLRLGAVLRVQALLTPEQRQELEERKHQHEGPKAGADAAGSTSDALDAAAEEDDDDDVGG